MGVRGLTSFLANNPELFRQFKLHDTKVIIDGLNLCYYLYLNSSIDFVYGGDYNKYGKLVSDYFGLFTKCGIEALVILDGAIDVSGRKIHTIKERIGQRLSVAKQIAKCGRPTERILPLLAIVVFKSVLADHGVQMYHSDYEADEHIAALAKHFQCPVLSLDSDFYIFDIPAGFIPLNSLDLDTLEEENGTFRMTCSIYYVEQFLSHFPGIRREVLPLFGTVMGNDYVNISVFANFFDSIQLSRRVLKGLHTAKRHMKMVTLLQWLQNKTVDTAISQILPYLKKDDREMVDSLVRNTIDGYVQCCEHVTQYLIGDSQAVDRSRLTSLQKNPIPAWFIREFRFAQLSSTLANVLASQKVFLMCQVEDVNCPSANECSLPIRKAMYNILLCSDTSLSSTMEEYDRKNSNIKCTKIEVVLTEDTPSFNLMPSINSNQKHGFILQVLSCDVEWLNTFPTSWHLLLACVQFVARFATPSVTDEFISSVLLSCLLLSFEDCLPTTCRTFGLKIEEECIEKARCNMKKYFKKPTHNNAKTFLTRIVHSYSQIQSCVLFVSYLNALLQNPLVPVKVHLLLNGSFLYNMTCNLESRANPGLYISETLGRDTDLDRLYSRLKEHFMSLVMVELLAKITTKTRTKNMKKKKVCNNQPFDFSVLVLDDSG